MGFLRKKDFYNKDDMKTLKLLKPQQKLDLKKTFHL